MLPLLRSIAAFVFYLVGSTFFLAYALTRSGVGGEWPVLWMQIADLPLLLAGIVYGVGSLALSFGHSTRASRIATWVVGIPLGIAFLIFCYLAFRGVF
jgi:heme/copper-type cytochrome/quinol oxidase subunit 3